MRKGVERSSHLELAHLLCIGMKRLAEKCPLRNEVFIPQVVEFLDLTKHWAVAEPGRGIRDWSRHCGPSVWPA